jgi:hypothetical protein
MSLGNERFTGSARLLGSERNHAMEETAADACTLYTHTERITRS